MRKVQDWSLRKIQTQLKEGVEDIDFLRILKKEHVKIPGVN